MVHINRFAHTCAVINGPIFEGIASLRFNPTCKRGEEDEGGRNYPRNKISRGEGFPSQFILNIRAMATPIFFLGLFIRTQLLNEPHCSNSLTDSLQNASLNVILQSKAFSDSNYNVSI